MIPIKFKEANHIFAEDQPEYLPLPAFVDATVPEVPVITCWQLTDAEIDQIVRSGKIYIGMWTFGGALQPLRPAAFKEDLIRPTVEEREPLSVTLARTGNGPTKSEFCPKCKSITTQQYEILIPDGEEGEVCGWRCVDCQDVVSSEKKNP